MKSKIKETKFKNEQHFLSVLEEIAKRKNIELNSPAEYNKNFDYVIFSNGENKYIDLKFLQDSRNNKNYL